jgi:putative (di)nucleoside polyphosphate hydrolase
MIYRRNCWGFRLRDADPDPEFDAWRWAELAELPGLAVPFKRTIYEMLARDFAAFAKET